MSETLPKGWAKTEFAKINFHKPKTVNPRNDPETEFELYSVPSFPIGKPEIRKGKDIGSSKQMVEPRDVLVCKINPRINRVWQVKANTGRPQIASSEWIAMRSNSLISDYLRYQFTCNYFRELICNDVTGVGGSLTRAQPKRVATFPVFIAPLPEQKRIAAKLDCLLAKVDACKARLDKVPEIIKRFRQSVLADAVSGKLTEDFTRNKKINYSFDTLKRVIRTLDQGWSPKCINSPALKDEWAVIKTSSVQQITFDAKENKKLPDTLTPRQHLNIKKNDILITRAGPRVRCGVTCLVEADHPNLLICDKVYRIRVKEEKVLPKYLTLILNSPAYLDAIEKIKTGSSDSGMNITQKKFFNISISIPCTDEQSKIVDRVEKLFTVADQLERKLQDARSRIDNSTASILSKAFRGELVPQDPNDEPAAMLLKRIHAEREALAATKKKHGRTPKKRSESGKKMPTQKAEVESEPAAPKPAKAGSAKATNGTVRPLKRAPKPIKKRFEKADLLKAFRKAAFRHSGLDKDSLLRLVGHRLGVRRLSQPIRRELETAIPIAIRRNIIARNGNGYYGATPTIHHYDDTELIKALRSVIRKGCEYDREHITAEAAAYLGFDKVSDAFTQKVKTVFRLAIRRGQLYRNGRYVGKV